MEEPVNNLNKILVLQKKAIRCILNLKKDESCKIHFTQLKIITVYSLYIYKTIIFVKNNQEKIIRQCNIHNYNTRNKNSFILKKHKKEKYKQSPSYRGIKFINSLPNSIKNEDNFVKFKNKLKVFLVNNPMYCLDDFFNVSKITP